MANLKEIVTKAVIGKTKKSTKEELIIETEASVNTVLGCWVINHVFSGHGSNGKVDIDGTYDINVWYSYDNNTKTNVLVRNFPYKDTVNVKLRGDTVLDNDHEIIVRSLSAPSVIDVKVDGSVIKLTTEKELGVEIVGDMKVRIEAIDDYDDYEDAVEELAEDKLDINIDDNYLNGVNQ